MPERLEKVPPPPSSDCVCGVRDSSPPPTESSIISDSSSHGRGKNSATVWRRYCALALVLSTASLLLCAVTWSQNVSAQRRLQLIEERLGMDDQLAMDIKLEELIDRKLAHEIAAAAAAAAETGQDVVAASGGGLGALMQTRSRRTIRQVGVATAATSECMCPPGKSRNSRLHTFILLFPPPPPFFLRLKTLWLKSYFIKRHDGPRHCLIFISPPCTSRVSRRNSIVFSFVLKRCSELHTPVDRSSVHF